jgi:hypothetical protein
MNVTKFLEKFILACLKVMAVLVFLVLIVCFGNLLEIVTEFVNSLGPVYREVSIVGFTFLLIFVFLAVSSVLYFILLKYGDACGFTRSIQFKDRHYDYDGNNYYPKDFVHPSGGIINQVKKTNDSANEKTKKATEEDVKDVINSVKTRQKPKYKPDEDRVETKTTGAKDLTFKDKGKKEVVKKEVNPIVETKEEAKEKKKETEGPSQDWI